MSKIFHEKSKYRNMTTDIKAKLTAIHSCRLLHLPILPEHDIYLIPPLPYPIYLVGPLILLGNFMPDRSGGNLMLILQLI